MDEFKTEETVEWSQVAAALPRWTGAPSIELAHQLNEQCVNLVCELAQSSQPALPPFILHNRDLWRLLETEARARVAAFPFVIVDVHFKDAEWWRKAMGQPFLSATDSTLFGDLMLETLLFARQSAREDLNVARAMFAMTPSVASLIGSLTLQQVRSIAAGNTRELKVRWEGDPEFWGELLRASRMGDEQAMTAVRRQGKLLFCGEVIMDSRTQR